jgi:NAD-dependent aldehyde dehydrogenases
MIEKKQFYINGKWTDPLEGSDFEVINPSNEEICAIISLGGQADTDSAVKAAKGSFISWWNASKEKKLSLLNNLLKIYISRSGEMAEAISIEMGAPKDWAIEQQSKTGENHIKTFIEKYSEFNFEKYYNKEAENYISYEPIGVCALITPWNWPMNQIALKVMPALAAGCTMILKPSEIAPLSGLLFAEMIDEAGFPPGVFNLVNGDGVGVETAIVCSFRC